MTENWGNSYKLCEMRFGKPEGCDRLLCDCEITKGRERFRCSTRCLPAMVKDRVLRIAWLNLRTKILRVRQAISVIKCAGKVFSKHAAMRPSVRANP